MSHQTGIGASPELRQFFATCKDGHIRMINVSIENEQLVLFTEEGPSGTWEEDFDRTVQPHLEEKKPCYVLYRFDRATNQGYEWLLISYVPDFAQVRQKMLYAATRSTLKQEFGGGQIKDEFFGTTKDELSIEGYKKHVQSQKAPAPLTRAEEELEMIKQNEVKVTGVDARHQTLQGIAFPIEDQALDKLCDIQAGRINYVQLMLDLKGESVKLAAFDTIKADEVSSRIPTDTARYHLYRYAHTFESDYLESIIFIYSMPGYKCPVRERMLYSSCKAPVIDAAETHCRVEISRKVEVDDPSEVTEKFIYDELHPHKDIVRQQFARPKGPAGRGPKRLMTWNKKK